MAYIAAGLVHALIIGALYFNFSSKPKLMDAHFAEKVDVVKATTVDESDILEHQELIKQQDLDKQRKLEKEQEKLKELEEKAEQEKQNIEDLKEKQEQEKEKALELEAERKKIALEKKQEEEKLEEEKKEREQKEKIRKAAEKKAAEKKAAEKKAEEEKQRAEEAAKRQEQLAALMEAEDAQLSNERTTTLIGKYSALIKQRVDAARTISPDFERWLEATLSIKLSPRGDVISARVVKSSGNKRYDDSVVSAILQATPLPMPDQNQEPAANEQLRNIEYDFKMPGVR